MKKVEDRHNKKINKALVVPSVGLVILVGWLLTFAPQFFPYLAGVIGITLLIYTGMRIFHYVTAKKCPKCGRALQDMGYKVVFKGALSEDGMHQFPPIVIRIFQCPKCEDVSFHKVDDSVLVPGSGYLNAINKQMDTEFFKLYFGQEMPVGTDFSASPTMSDEAYHQVKENIKDKMRIHNIRAGFTDR